MGEVETRTSAWHKAAVIIYVLFALGFFLAGLGALSESETVAGLLCFMVVLLISLQLELGAIRLTLQRREDQR